VTATRVLVGAIAVWMALVVLTAWGSMLAAVLGYLDLSMALHHTSWMCVLSGAMCAAAGLVIVMAWELNKEVRTARVLGTVSALEAARVETPVGSGAVRRVSSSQPTRSNSG